MRGLDVKQGDSKASSGVQSHHETNRVIKLNAEGMIESHVR